MVDTINSEIQKSELSEYVVLWELDLTNLGDGIYHFVEAAKESGNIVFNGITYVPFNFEAEGFEYSGTGSPPTPTLKVATTDEAISSLIYSFNDLCGGKVTRTRTFRKFLDGESSANVNEYFSKDVFTINTKIAENKLQAEFELNSFMDQQGTMLPRGQLVPYCRAIYRKRSGSSWIIHPSDLACPYAGSSYFTENDASTTDPTLDKCSHLPSGCKLRFGATADLPFMGFPGTQTPLVT